MSFGLKETPPAADMYIPMKAKEIIAGTRRELHPNLEASMDMDVRKEILTALLLGAAIAVGLILI